MPMNGIRTEKSLPPSKIIARSAKESPYISHLQQNIDAGKAKHPEIDSIMQKIAVGAKILDRRHAIEPRSRI